MSNNQRTKLVPLLASAASLTLLCACGTEDEPGDSGSGGSGGAVTGGASGAAGSPPLTGGQGAASSGGATGGTGATPGGGTTGVTGGAGGTQTGGAGGAGGSATGGAGATGGTGGAPPVSGCRAPEQNATIGNACPGTPPPALTLTEIVSGLDAPTFVTQAPGDTRLYVLERSGRILIVDSGAILPTPFLDIQSVVRAGGPAGEQGLLGLAFDPDYEQSGRFWVNYTGEAGVGDTVIASYQATPGESADPNSASVLAVVPQASFFGNHNGGMIAFGADGCLYVGMGDGGGADDPDGHGQNVATELGAMLRLDVDNFPTPAPGNMSGPGIDPHLWSYGLRNPWRFSFDRQTGDLYMGDVGQDAWEEVDVEPRGFGGRNYGWNTMEGMVCFGAATCEQTGLTLPAAVQDTDIHNAIIGGYVYRGSAIPGMVGRYIYGDHVSRQIWSFVYSGEQDGQPQICDDYALDTLTPSGDITSFGEDLAGEIYVLTLQGTLYRIDPG